MKKTFSRLALFAIMPLAAVAAVVLFSSYTPDCPTPGGHNGIVLLPNRDNCSTFYECDNGSPVLCHCPEDLLYCEEQQTCSWQWDINCTFNCTGSSGGGNTGSGFGCGYSVYEAKDVSWTGMHVNFTWCKPGCPSGEGRDPQYIYC